MPDADPPQPAAAHWQNKRLGKFRLLSLLGKGSMGKVFLAEDTTLQRQVALKVLSIPEDAVNAENQTQQFIREARAAARLNHPHIVSVLEIAQQQDMLYIAMDLVEGGDVKRLIHTGGPVAPAKACDLAADAGDALAFGHGLGVIHRDVKPSNLMLTRSGRCKLADFGLADLGDPNDDFRLPDGIIGTPRYMAPEVARGLPALPASDQYSLAATLWHMLVGRPIFEGKHFREVLKKQIHEPLPSLAARCPDLPDSLVEAIEKALSKDPAARFADVEAFAKILRNHSVALAPAGGNSGGASGGSGSFDSLSAGGESLSFVPASQRPRKSQTPWLVGAMAAGALVVGGGVSLVMLSDQSVPTSPPPATVAPPLTPASPTTPGNAATPDTPPPPAVATPAPALTPTPTSIPTTPPPPAPVGPFTADQTDAIKPLVKDDTLVTVTGVVAEASLSGSGKTFIVNFVGNNTGDFQIIWKPNRYPDMANAFGGANGEGIAGKTIRVTGELSSLFGTPQINVTSPTQIEILDE